MEQRLFKFHRKEMQMKTISVGQSFKLYMLTLNQCGMNILNMSDELIEYNILEEFIIGSTSFFSKFTLDRLLEHGLIDENIYNRSELLQQKVMKLDNSNLWNVESIKKDSEWKEVLELADKIKELIYEKWTMDEINQIFTM